MNNVSQQNHARQASRDRIKIVQETSEGYLEQIVNGDLLTSDREQNLPGFVVDGDMLHVSGNPNVLHAVLAYTVTISGSENKESSNLVKIVTSPISVSIEKRYADQLVGAISSLRKGNPYRKSKKTHRLLGKNINLDIGDLVKCLWNIGCQRVVFDTYGMKGEGEG